MSLISFDKLLFIFTPQKANALALVSRKPTLGQYDIIIFSAVSSVEQKIICYRQKHLYDRSKFFDLRGAISY